VPLPTRDASDVEELELRVRARQCGADGYIRKTGDETDFIRQVQQALAQV